MQEQDQTSPKQTRVSRLLLRLFTAFLLVAFVGLAVAAFLVDRNVQQATKKQVEERLSYQTTMLGQMTANALFGPLDASDSSLNGAVHKLGEAVHTQLSLIAVDGRVAADSSSEETQAIPSQLAEPEIVLARAHGYGVSVRGSGAESRMFVAHAIVQDAQLLGFARSSLPMALLDAQVHEVRVRMATGALVAGLVALLFAFAVSTRVIRPVRALTEGAQRIGAGALQTVIRVESQDEIGELAAAFNQMTSSLRGMISRLDSRNAELQLVLDNVSQGLMLIDREGKIASERSAVIDTWFGAVPPDATLWSYLEPIDLRVSKMARLGWLAVRDGFLPLALNLAQMPAWLRVGERDYELSYQPILSDRELERVLIVVSDVTERVRAERAEHDQREFVAVLDRVLKDRTGFQEFLDEARETVRRIADPSASGQDVRRDVHTLRGNAAVFGLTRLTEVCRKIESSLAESGRAPEIQELASRWQELETRFNALFARGAENGVLEIELGEQRELLAALERGTSPREIARVVREWELEPVERTLARFAQHARALGQRLGKGEIEVRVEARGARLDRERFRPFWAAFLHVVRNAVDHGLEAPAERRQLGKPELGRLYLAAQRSAHSVSIEVRDDGRGVDWDTLSKVASERGMAALPREELLFVDGLSSLARVGEVSGRGVGLSAVRATCRALGGDVTVTSQAGAGTTLRFTLPLTGGAAGAAAARSRDANAETSQPGATKMSDQT